MAMELLPEDYAEPRCPLCVPQYKENGRNVVRIPVGRVIEKYDEYIGMRDSDAAERHLLYWLAEAEAGGDSHGRLTVINELMGFYRNTERRDEAYKYAALGLEAVHDDKRLITATTYINAATVYKSFGEASRAYPLFVRAREIYEELLEPDDERLAGLYNNMALALSDLGRYSECYELYRRAIEIMIGKERGTIDAAISYLNMANAREAEKGADSAAGDIDDDLACAEALLEDAADRRDKYYAYVCARCAPTFRRYGMEDYAKTLEARSQDIYEGA